MKSIDLNNKVHFIYIPDKLKRVTSLVFSKGLINNNQSKVTSINYLLNIS